MSTISKSNTPTDENPFQIVRTKRPQEAGRILIDKMLKLQNPKIYTELSMYMQEDSVLEEFLGKITLSEPCEDDRCSFFDFVSFDVRQQQLQNMQESWKAMEMATKFTSAYKTLLVKIEKRYVSAIMRMFNKGSLGSFHHFRYQVLNRKIFEFGLLCCPNFVEILLTETKEGTDILYFNLLICNVINPPIQDCILLAFVQAKGKKHLAEKFVESEYMDRFFDLILHSHKDVSLAACTTLMRIFQMYAPNELSFLSIPMISNLSNVILICERIKDRNGDLKIRESAIELIHSMITTKQNGLGNVSSTISALVSVNIDGISNQSFLNDFCLTAQFQIYDIIAHCCDNLNIFNDFEWDYLISGFLTRHKNCSIFLNSAFIILKAVLSSNNPEIVKKLQAEYFIEDLVLNFESRFANGPYVRELIMLISKDPHIEINTAILPRWDEILESISNKNSYDPMSKFSIPTLKKRNIAVDEIGGAAAKDPLDPEETDVAQEVTFD